MAFINKCKNYLYKSTRPFMTKEKVMWRNYTKVKSSHRRGPLGISSSSSEGRKGMSYMMPFFFIHDAIFLHTTAVAKKVHFIHLPLVLCFQLLLLHDKFGLQLFLLGEQARCSSTSLLNWEFSYSTPLNLASIISHFSFNRSASARIALFSPSTSFNVLAPSATTF